MDKNALLDGMDIVIGAFTKANVALPLVVSMVSLIKGIWEAQTGEVLDLSILADKIEAQCRQNATYGEAEVARLRALLAPPT